MQAAVVGPTGPTYFEKAQQSVIKHSKLVTAVILLLVVYLIVMGAKRMLLGRDRMTNGTGMTPISNFDMVGMSPLPFRGSMHAGMGGSIDSDTTNTQLAAYVPEEQPPLRRVMARRAAALRAAGLMNGAMASRLASGRSKFSNPPCTSPDQEIDYGFDENGMPLRQCATPQEVTDLDTLDYSGFDTDLRGSCSGPWSPEAVLESQALFAVQAMDRPSPGEGRLDRASEGYSGADKGLSDSQLQSLMSFGSSGAP